MALFSQYGQSESPFVRVGDGGFVGMDYRTAPDKLKEGVYSYGENVRVRTKEVVTRPGNPYINWFYPDNYPWDLEYSNGGVELQGTWSSLGFIAGSGQDASVNITSGTTSGTPYADGYDHIRFGNGSGPAVVLKATGEESGGVIPVETTPVANIQSVTGEIFTWCKQDLPQESSSIFNRSVIADSGQTVVTTGTFRDPDSNDYVVIVTDTSTWFGREHNRPFEVTIPDGVDDNAYLLQCFEKLLLFRGTGQSVLEYSTASGAWTGITASSSGDFTAVIPNADRATFFQNRVWVHVGDKLYFSDIGVYTRYYWLENEVRINVGENDDIVALFPFGKYAMLVFKERSIHLLDNLYGDIPQNMRVRQISSRVGCGAADTITNVGNRVWFCDKAGDVWDISQVDEDRMELSGEPVSWPIKTVMEESGAKNYSTWMGAYYDSYFFLFIRCEPSTFLDSYLTNATGLNRVAVYDTISEAWVSFDSTYNMDLIGRPMIINALESPRLLMMDKIAKNLRVIGYGTTDDGGFYTPHVKLMTRGYYVERGTTHQFDEIRYQLARWDADYYVDVFTDGEEEYRVSGAIAQQIINIQTTDANRNTYLNQNESSGYADWDSSNSASDFDNPYRYDYSIYPSNSGSGMYLESSAGIPPMRFQQTKMAMKINKTGEYLQVRFRNQGGNNGLLRIKDVSVAARKNMNLQGERV